VWETEWASTGAALTGNNRVATVARHRSVRQPALRNILSSGATEQSLLLRVGRNRVRLIAHQANFWFISSA